MAVQTADLRRHLLEELLPLWNEHGVDRERGGFHPTLGPDMKPGPEDFKRLVGQTRQIYAFSHAHLMGAPEWALKAARHGFTFLCDCFWDPDHAGWFLTTELDGTPRDRRKDSYAHAFVLFAMAYYYRASQDQKALELASNTLDLLERYLSDPALGGFWEGASQDWQPISEPRRQNPHMHLLEAFLALHEVTQEERYLQHAHGVVKLFRERFLDREQGSLGEYFSDDWQPHPSAWGEVLEPGHHFEWIWLLHQYAAQTGRREVLEDADRLFRFALRVGIDPSDGAAYDEVNRREEVVRDTKRLWPQTEHIKALVARYETLGEREALARLANALEFCFARYVDPDHRGWNDHITCEGEVFSERMPATSIYHITLALSEVIRVLEEAPS